MTDKTTVDRAAAIIADVFRPLVRGYADALGHDLATELAKAGLLAADELTCLDGPESPTPARVGDTIESADDPRIDSLPAESILRDLDGDDMEKTATGEWRDIGGITIESPGCGPWTVHRIGNEADQ